nr:hypothetical protein [Bacteroidota bacterium]
MQSEKGLLMPDREPSEAQLHALMLEVVKEATKKANDAKEKLYQEIHKLVQSQKGK